MYRKPVFDAIRYERMISPTKDEIAVVDKFLSKLGFPANPADGRIPLYTPNEPVYAPGQLRRAKVADEIRRQRGFITPEEVGPFNDLMDFLQFPGVLATEPKTPTPPSPATITAPGQAASATIAGQGSLATITKPKTSTGTKAAIGTSLVALIGATAALTLNTTLDRWEGNELDPYYDIVKVATNCRGNTKDVVMGKRLTAEQCAIINEAAAVKHTTPVLKATPLLTTPTKTQQTHPNQLAAAISFAYNVGNGAYATSSIDRYFDQGYWYTACDKLLLWNKAGGKVVKGLTLRRQWERELCRTGVPVEYRK